LYPITKGKDCEKAGYGEQETDTCVSSSFHCHVSEFFSLLGCYKVLIC